MKLEKIIDSNIDPGGAAAQTAQPWVSLNGPWIVTGTDNIDEAIKFAKEAKDAI